MICRHQFNEKFQIAFWHPFGPHGKEMPEEIVKRKRLEIEANNGWTLWSFQYRTMPTLNAWYDKLLSGKCNAVFVFCSEGQGAVDPAPNRPPNCKSFRYVGGKKTEWQSMPRGVRVPHPFGLNKKKKQASAFVVQRVIYPVEPFRRPFVKWFSLSKGPWCQEKVPTRGEYLIRPGGTIAMRPVRAVLELKWPYLAVVNADEPPG